MLAVLCSGQGAQHRGMLRISGNVQREAAIFSAAARELGNDPREFLRAPETDLFANRTAQVLCVTQALVVGALLEPVLTGSRHLVLGYSVGQLAALGISGALDAAATIGLAGARAEIMEAASEEDDGLAFVRGLASATIERLALHYGVEIAIVNPNLTFVIGGPRAALGEFVVAAIAAGAARSGLLPVRVASHTSRLRGAVAPFRDAIGRHRPRIPDSTTLILSGIDGSPLFDANALADSLARQLATTIRWDRCLESAVERGATVFLELGPGRALADMVRGMYPDLPARSADDFRTGIGLCRWLERQMQ